MTLFILKETCATLFIIERMELQHGQVISPWHQQVQRLPDLLGYPSDTSGGC